MFFSSHAQSASATYKARFHLWRLHLNALNGDPLGMVVDYLEARDYAAALDSTHQAHLHLNGAYAYREIREYDKALDLIERAQALVARPRTYEDSVTFARALHAEGESLLRKGDALDQAERTLRAAAERYDHLGDASQVATATTLLGETAAARGDTTAALGLMERGVQIARGAGAVRSVVYALYRLGELQRQRGDLAAAERTIQEALEAEGTFREFHRRLLYQQARIHEAHERYSAATTLYSSLREGASGTSYLEELEAELQAQDGQIRVLLATSERTRRRTYWLWGMLAALAVAAMAVGWRQWRRPAHERLPRELRDALVIPQKLSTGATLEELEHQFSAEVGSELLGGRLARFYAVLFDPDLVLPHINDPVLVEQVRSQTLDNNTALFMAAAEVEEAFQGRLFKNNPANTLGAYLRGEFKRREWPWPKNPYAWKTYFMEQHADTIF